MGGVEAVRSQAGAMWRVGCAHHLPISFLLDHERAQASELDAAAFRPPSFFLPLPAAS